MFVVIINGTQDTVHHVYFKYLDLCMNMFLFL